MALVTCVDCGRQFSDQAHACVHCGRPAKEALGVRPASAMADSASERLAIEARVANEKKSVGVAYVLYFLLGLFGVHNFYVGRTGVGVLQLVGVIGAFLLIGVASGQEEAGRSSSAETTLALSGLVWLVIGVSWLIDLFVIPGAVRKHSDELRKQFAGRA